MDPLEALSRLSEQGYYEFFHFFDWLFGFEKDNQRQGGSRSFNIPPETPVKSVYINGPSNGLGSLYQTPASQITAQLDAETLENLKKIKQMDFESKMQSSETKEIQNNVTQLSQMVENPETDSNKLNNTNAVINDVKTQCQTYIDNHQNDRWTPTNIAKSAFVNNTLQTVNEVEKVINNPAPQKTEVKEEPVNVQPSVNVQQQPEVKNEPINVLPQEPVIEDLKTIAKQPNKVSAHNKVFEYRKGSHRVTDISKFFKPVDYKLLDIKKMAPDLIRKGYRGEYNPTPNFKGVQPKEHAEQAKKVLDTLIDFGVTRKDFDLLSDHLEIITPKKRKEKTTYIRTQDSKYDVNASKLYKEINKYLKLRPYDLNDPNSLASRFKQIKDSVFAEGTLEIPEDSDGIFIDATGKSKVEDELNFDGDKDLLASAQMLDEYNGKNVENKETYMRDLSDMPLFPKEPHPSDISQGRVGDCYFISYLSKMAQEDPQGIKDMLKDNGNGTVTCRFYNEERKPVYVTVNKTVPYDRVQEGTDVTFSASNGERVPLWVHMAEKAYMMSGIRPFRERDQEDIEKTYKEGHPDYEIGQDHPTALEQKLYTKRFGNVPFDQERYNRYMQHNYFGIEAGNASRVARHLTGKNAYVTFLDRFNANNITRIFRNDSALYKFTDVFGDKYNQISEDQPAVTEVLLKLAAGKIDQALHKNDNVPDAKKPSSHITIQDIEKHIMDYKNSKTYENYMKSKPKVDMFEKVAKGLVSAMKEHQKNNIGKTPLISDKGSGAAHYSKYDEGVFDFMAKKLDTGLHIGVGLQGHAYSVMGYKIDGDKKKLVLRNPWASTKEQEGFEYNKLDKRAKNDYSSKVELGGLIEIEINEFTAKASNFNFEEETKVMTLEDMQNKIVKQLVDTYVSEQPEEEQERLSRSMNSPESIENLKKADFVQQLSKEYMENEAIRYYTEKMGEIPVNAFYRDIIKHTGSQYLTKPPQEKQKDKEMTVEDVIIEKGNKAGKDGFVSNEDVEKANAKVQEDVHLASL